MSLKTRRKRERLPFAPDFAEDKPGQFLRAQVERKANESYYSSSDQEAQDADVFRGFDHSKGHKRTASAVQALDLNTVLFKSHHFGSQDLESSMTKQRKSSLGEYFSQTSGTYWRPSNYQSSDLSEADQRAIEFSGLDNCVIEESPSKEESRCLSEDDLTIIDLHTNMSKIQQQRLQEKDQLERKKVNIKKQLLEMLSSTQEREELITPRMHWTVRTSSASNATQVAAGSSFVLEGIEQHSATQEGYFSRGRPSLKEDESCLVKMETEDFIDQEYFDKPKRVLQTAFKTVFSSLPSSIVKKCHKSIDTMVNSTLVLLIDTSRNFQGLYRLNQTYSLLHKLTGLDSAPNTFPCASVKQCYTFNTQLLNFTEAASTKVSATTHAVAI
mmetsp:Transcript_6375/g.11097  ORF Transcript_6375/g.11097 Transcript_6375/m.11097 type:complete len:385 (-) Transcript_6375:43-1197(-)